MIRSAVSLAGKTLLNTIHLLNNARDIYYSFSPTVRHAKRMTPYGFTMIAGNSMHHRLMQAGAFEPDEVAIVSDHLQRANVFIDIGANIGFYTCLARSFGKRVVAIEPQPQNLRYLYANLQANGWSNVEVFPLGLDERPGLATLYGVSSTGASMVPGWAAQPRRFRKTIPVSTLDVLLGSRFQGERLFVKIDVEGFEHSVLRGCRETLTMRPQPTWMVEICFSKYHPGGFNTHYLNTFDLFFNAGYAANTANEHSEAVGPADVYRRVKECQNDTETINYLFEPREAD
ncbi:MAG: FkbM family methyltransferase [Deltaproteobacteria bacterium]|nr:FkbM family methyltransferase [Deltaproteobacteria bacterium]